MLREEIVKNRGNNLEKTLKIVKKCSGITSILFMIELVFGYSGTVFVIGGLAIRHILFLLTFICLYAFLLLYCAQHKIKLFAIKNKTSVLGSFTKLDWAFTAFMVITVFSFLVTPMLTSGSLRLAKSEILDSLMMLSLYYPIRFLLQWKQFSLQKFLKLFCFLSFLLSILHIILFVGQTYNRTFIRDFFSFLKRLGGSQSSLPQIILGHKGYPRVVFATSLYIILGIGCVLTNFPKWKWTDYLALFVHVFALMTTMTKSIWLGVIIAIAVYAIFVIIQAIRKKEWKVTLKLVVALNCCVLLVFGLNETIFQGRIFNRMGSTFITKEPEDLTGDEIKDTEIQSSAVSNQIKVEQTKRLLKKWLNRPIFGYGYGSYVQGYLRSTEAIFSYEMQFPALLMKTGIVGIGVLVVLIAVMYKTVSKFSKNKIAKYAWLFILIAYMLAAQTNPLLLSFTGMSIVLYLLVKAAAFQVNSEEGIV